MIIRDLSIVIAVATVMTTTATVARADEAAAPAAAAESLRVVRDSQTGELRAPTPEELQEMIRAEQAAAPASRATAAAQPLQVREYPGGMKSVVLGPEHLISIEARRDADGKLVVTHESPKDEHPATTRDLPTE